MKIKRLRILNFRSIKKIELLLDDTTVFVGPNNVGKTAIFEALRVALTRRWGQRGTGFTEYDVHCPNPDDDPRQLPPVSIEIFLEEDELNPWPDDMVQALDDFATLNRAGKNVISLRVSCTWTPETDDFEPSWEFLDSSGVPLSGKSRRATNLSTFFEYLPLLWLPALRDAIEEFGPRSAHWGKLLKAVKLSNETKTEVKESLESLDKRLLNADPKLTKIAETVGQATQIAITDSIGAARLRMVPLNIWDLLSRASVVLRNSDIRPWLPLDHHGQGLQSLSIIFLLQASVAQLLAEDMRPGLEPLFAIEEPEVHLHPQAARTLWSRISSLPGQKLVTTHSPYFVQHVPIHNLRIIKIENGESEAAFVPRYITSKLQWNANVEQFSKHMAHMFVKTADGFIRSDSWFNDRIENGLANCWRHEADPAAKAAEVAKLRHECRVLVSQEDEDDLSVAGRRIRGEIFFARKWILVEGQCEYILMHAIGNALSWPLDQHGIAVIDFKNHGNPGIYAGLAEAFGLPWRMIIDGDDGGLSCQSELLKRGFNQIDIDRRVRALTAGHNLEDQLIADGHESLLRSILEQIEVRDATTCAMDQLKSKLKNNKSYALGLAKRILSDPSLALRMPLPLVETMEDLRNRKL